jgi:4-hydroxy-2-oxoheptanedioate aldolase
MTQPAQRSFPAVRLVPVAVLAVALVATRGVGLGQAPAPKPTLHLNPAIAKWTEGKPAIGVSTSDFSLDLAQTVSRAGVDFVRMDMEHAPFDVDTIRLFLIGTTDRAGILKKGNAQLPVAPIVRIPPYGREAPDWVVKQALDAGMMGIKFPTIDTMEQALRAVRSMRYPPARGFKYAEPAGLRGKGAGNAIWFWGVDTPEYERRADVWPLNPEGDLLAIIMIESAEGLKNVEEIVAVPGVGAIFVGNVGDLPTSLGVPASAPEVEAGLQRSLQACKKYNVVCGAVVNEKNIEQRIKEGWRYLDIGRAGGGLASGPDAALRAGRAATK